MLRADSYKVALVGLIGGEEANPFTEGPGFKLFRMVEWAGLDQSRLTLWELGPSDPITPPEGINVIMPLGNGALERFIGHGGILQARGYIQHGPNGTHLLPTVHPAFVQKGQSKYASAFIHDLQKAVDLARGGLQIQLNDYVIDPLPGRAYEWARAYRDRLSADPGLRLAYDIETPGKGEDEGDLGEEDDPTYFIHRIGFSDGAHRALTVPWSPEYIPAIRLCMESPGEKVVWNASFDNPRIRHNGVGIGGTVHDGMVAWHVLHSDLPKGLAFVATFTCPWQPAWKHLSHASPGFYNCTDADVEWRSMDVIEAELKRVGLWDVYLADVVEMEPILLHMHEKGMPVDGELRLQRAIQLAEKQTAALRQLESLVPLSARSWSPKEGYVKTAPGGWETDPSFIGIDVEVSVKRCDRCGLVNPTAPHFRTFKRPSTAKPQNPCSGASKVEKVETVRRAARLDDFKPSRVQLIKYQLALGRQVPTTFDMKTKERKPSMNEKAIKELQRKFPDDKLYPLVLEYRELDKLAGTYIGRPVAD